MTYRRSEKSSVENPCVDLARELGIPHIKVNPLWAAGWQDRIFFVPGGKILIIEFKRPGGKASPLQVERHKKLIALGYDHHVIEDKDEGKALIRSRVEAHRLHEKGGKVHDGKPGVRAVPRSRAAKD